MSQTCQCTVRLYLKKTHTHMHTPPLVSLQAMTLDLGPAPILAMDSLEQAHLQAVIAASAMADAPAGEPAGEPPVANPPAARLAAALRDRRAELMAERAAARAESRRVSQAIRRDNRQRTRLMTAARQLSDADLALILRARGHLVTLQ